MRDLQELPWGLAPMSLRNEERMTPVAHGEGCRRREQNCVTARMKEARQGSEVREQKEDWEDGEHGKDLEGEPEARP